MSKFYKNLVLCGEVDYHCLLCEESMDNVADVEKHIRWEQHRKLMKDVLYLPKYKTDCIIKVGDQFYCEVCNILLTTTIKTALHIKDQSHITNKQTPARDVLNNSDKIVREGKHIKILNNYVVTKNEWNGIIDQQCLLCDIDLEDVGNHLKRPNHVRKLIPSRIVFLDGNNFYRMIEGDIFYCFICKTPYSKTDLDSHFSSQEHINKKKKLETTVLAPSSTVNNGASTSKQSFNDEFKQNMKKMFKFSEKNNNSPTVVSNDNQDITSKVKEFQKEGIDINFEKSLAICRKCKFTPAYTVKAITEHIKMHKKAETNSPGFQIPDETDEDLTSESDSEDSIGGDTIYSLSDEEDKENVQENQYIKHLDFGKIRSDLAKFGKEHHIKLVNAGSKGHCTLCDIYISAHIKNFKQHIKGLKHVTNVQAKIAEANKAKKDDKNKSKKPNDTTKKPEYTTKPLKEYLRNIFFVKAMDDFWINRQLCIDKHSFALLRHLKNNGKYDKIKCVLCDKTFASDKDQEHCETDAHRGRIFETKVITSLKKEFVREVRPNLFHCGFCNETTPSYETLKQHLRSASHRGWRDQQEMVADNTDDMWSSNLDDTQSAETDIIWNQLMGNRLL